MCFKIRAATGDSKYECSGLRRWTLRPAPGAESLAVPSDPCCRSVTRLTRLRPAGSQRWPRNAMTVRRKRRESQGNQKILRTTPRKPNYRYCFSFKSKTLVKICLFLKI